MIINFLSLCSECIIHFSSSASLDKSVKMMMFWLVLLVILASASADPRAEFESFKHLHAKKYASFEEEEMRFQHFQDNLEKIEKHNSEGHSWRLGITKFADLPK